MKLTEGGGTDHEEENIEVLEMSVDRAIEMMKTGEIRDAKTIMLLQYALLNNLL
jgi:GDP-mannose pyrophosphatase NudK